MRYNANPSDRSVVESLRWFSEKFKRHREVAAALRAANPAANAAGDGSGAMTAFPGQGAPVPGPRGQDGHKYALWDAAYVLGSLSEMDWREFDAHLGECRACRDAVTELSGMPALLSLLDRDEVTDEDDPVAVRPPWAAAGSGRSAVGNVRSCRLAGACTRWPRRGGRRGRP